MRYFIVLDKERNTLWGTMGKGVYEVEGPESNPQAFTYTEGIHIEIEIPKSEVAAYFKKDINLMKSHIQRAVNAESKLVKAGQELADLRKQNPDRSRYRYEQKDKFISEVDEVLEGICKQYNLDIGGIRNMIGRIERLLHRQAEEIALLGDQKVKDAKLMEESNHTLKRITEILTEIDKEQGGFEISPEWPATSLGTIQGVLQLWRKEIKEVRKERDSLIQQARGLELSVGAWNEYDRNIDQNLTDFLSSLGYSIEGQDTQGKSEMLREVYEDMNKPIKAEVAEPIKLPGDVYRAMVRLSHTFNTNRAEPFLMALQHLYRGVSPWWDHTVTSDLNIARNWADENHDSFLKAAIYGYVYEETHRDKMIEEISMIMMGTHKNTTRELAEVIYDKFVICDDYEVVDDED